MQLAPAFHSQPKSRFNPSRIAKHLRRAAAKSVAWQVYSPRAVFMDGRCIGLVRSEIDGRHARVIEQTHAQWMGWDNADGIDAAVAAGKLVEPDVFKDLSSWNKQTVWADMWPCGPDSGDYTGAANTARAFTVSSPGSMKGLLAKSPSVADARNLLGFRLAVLAGNANEAWDLELYDRVGAYDSCSIVNSLTSMTNTTAMPRYIGSGQYGLKISPTAQTLLGATAANLSALVITDNLGNAGVSIPNIYTRPWYANANAPTGSVPASVCCPHDNTNTVTITPWLQNPAGVTGARKIELYTSDAANTGSVSFVMLFPLVTMWCMGTGIAQLVDFSRSMFTLPKIYDTACLSMLGIESSGNTSKLMGSLLVGHS